MLMVLSPLWPGEGQFINNVNVPVGITEGLFWQKGLVAIRCCQVWDGFSQIAVSSQNNQLVRGRKGVSFLFFFESP